MSMRRRVGDHDAAGLGLPPVVVDRQAEHLLAPPHGLGVERLADAGDEAQLREAVARAPAPAPAFISMRIAVGAVYQTLTRSLLQDAVPALGVELGLVDDAGHAVQQRRDDAVGGAGDPARVGGAPEDVVGMQVERVAAGGEVRHHRLVHVHRALGRAGGAAGEVQQRRVVGAWCGTARRVSRRRAISVAQVERAGARRWRRRPRRPAARAAASAAASRIFSTLRR